MKLKYYAIIFMLFAITSCGLKYANKVEALPKQAQTRIHQNDELLRTLEIVSLKIKNYSDFRDSSVRNTIKKETKMLLEAADTVMNLEAYRFTLSYQGSILIDHDKDRHRIKSNSTLYCATIHDTNNHCFLPITSKRNVNYGAIEDPMSKKTTNWIECDSESFLDLNGKKYKIYLKTYSYE